jgi:hypothetical protein
MSTKDAVAFMNGPVATAIGRAILFATPIVFGVTVYAGRAWLNQQVGAAPAVVFLKEDGAQIGLIVHEHTGRIRSLEEFQRVSSASQKRVEQALDEQTREFRALTREFYRLAGAVEASNKR